MELNMMRLLFFSMLLVAIMAVQAKSMVRIKAIGSSPKGQFVAVEEFGFIGQNRKAYSKIKVLNVWKNTYVGDAIEVLDKTNDLQLEQVRSRAKRLAGQNLKKYNISL
jgi:predicted secreted protein